METDVLGCTINQPLARFVCCWVFCFLFYFFHKLSKVLVLSGAINVPTHSKSNLPSGFILHLLQGVIDLPQWEVLLFLTLEEFLKIYGWVLAEAEVLSPFLLPYGET